MLPKPPQQLDVAVVEVKIKKEKDAKHEDGRFRVDCIKSSDGMMTGWTWCAMLAKDLYRQKEWHKILPKIKPLYLALHGGWNTTIQVDVWYEGKWNTIWHPNNHFDTFAQAKKSMDDYTNFTLNEGKKIRKLIDAGKTFKHITSKLSKDHSGNTYAWAMHYGISKAKNRDNAKAVRAAHNKDCGGTGKEEGTINPAVLTIGVKKK